MNRAYHLKEARAFARNALANGGHLATPTQVEWDIASKCSNPQRREIIARHDPREDWYSERPINTAITVRCRRCQNCLRARGAHWRLRAQAELALAQRSWFGTLTLNDAEQVKALYRAQLAAKRRGVPWEAPVKRAPGESQEDFARRVHLDQFSRVVRAIGPEIGKWLKRIRKESGAKLRYILVAEAHKSGKPHFHILISEVAGSSPILKRTLQRQWKLGFSQFRLVQEGEAAARYVTKYLTKSAIARVRASEGYGSPAKLVAHAESV